MIVAESDNELIDQQRSPVADWSAGYGRRAGTGQQCLYGACYVRLRVSTVEARGPSNLAGRDLACFPDGQDGSAVGFIQYFRQAQVDGAQTADDAFVAGQGRDQRVSG